MKKTIRLLVIFALCVAMILCVASCKKKPKDDPCSHVAAAAVKENVKQPGCTTEGSYDEVVYCKSCGDELSRQKKSTKAIGHSLGEFVSDNNATCTEDGTKTKKCLNQGCSYKETVTDIGSAKGHIASDMQFNGEYCNGNPLAKIYCGECSAYMGEYGHKYEKSITPPTCTDAGKTVYTCSECSHSYSEPIKSQGHVTSAWETSVESTCSTEGTLTKKCLVCDSVVDTKSIKKLEHTYVGSLSGSNMYYSCTECGDSYTEAVQTPVYTITFMENGAAQIEDVSILEYAVPTLPIPEKDGYIFVGWYSDSALTKLYTEASVTSNLTLYAKWEEPVTVTDDEDIVRNAPLDYAFKVTSSVQLNNSNVNDYVKITTITGEVLSATVSYSDGKYEISCAYSQGKSYFVTLSGGVSFVGKDSKTLLIFTEGESENVIKLKDGVLSFSYEELFGAYETEEGLLLITYKDILNESQTAVFYEDNENAYRFGVRVKIEGKLDSYSTYLVETLTVDELFEECDISHSDKLNFDNAEINDNLSAELESAFLASDIYSQYTQAARAISRKYGGDISDPVFKAKFYTERDNFVIKLSVTAKMGSGIAFIMDYYINLAFDVDFKLNGEKSTLLLLTDMTNTVYLNVEINGEAMHGASTTARQTLLNEYRRVFNEISERNMKLDPADANKENKTKKIDIATIPMKTGLVTVDLHITAEFEFGMMGGLSAKLVHRVESEIGMVNGKFVSDYEAKLVSISGYAYSGAEIYGGIGVSLDVSFCGLTGYVKGRVGLRGEVLGSAVISINERSSYVLGSYYFDSEVVIDMSVGVKYVTKVLFVNKTLFDESVRIAEVGIPFITLGDEIIYLHFTDDSYASSSESLDLGYMGCDGEANISNKVNNSILSIDADSLVSKVVKLPCNYAVESVSGDVIVRAYGNGNLKISGNGSFLVQLKVKYGDILEKTVYVKGTLDHDYSVMNVNDDTLRTPATCLNKATYYYSCSDCGKISDIHYFKHGELSSHVYSNDYTCHDRECLHCDYVLAATTDHNFQTNGVCGCGFVDPNAILTPGVSLTLSNGEYTITGYTGNATEIIIPSEHEGMPIVAIADNAFNNCTSITKVFIGDNVKSIGARAFNGCTGLTSINIPDSVTSIGASAFNGCTGLTSVYVTDVAKWYKIKFLTTESSNPLYYAHNLYLNGELVTELVIPDTVTSIGSYAFYNCTCLTSITIPDSVTSIGSRAFYGCTGLTSVTIGKGVTSIGAFAFENCTGLTEINFNATSMNDLGSSEYNRVFGHAGKNAGGITVNIGANVTRIPAYLFKSSNDSYSTNIVKVIFAENSVCTSIGDHAFYNCTDLNAVYITDIAKWCEIEFSRGESNPLYYAHNLYLNGELVTEVVIPNGVTSIGSCAFYRCTSLVSVIIENGVTSIDSWAFRDCTGLTSITIPDSVTNISDSAFSGCTSLTSITIPDGVTSIGSSAFSGCTALTAVYITDIAKWCEIEFSINPFAYAHNLYLNGELVTELVIPNSVTSIGNSAFSCCTGLTSINIPDSVTSIGNYAFQNCTCLTSVTIENGVTSIGNSAFENCTSLTSITIPDSVTSIGNYAFYGCRGLTSITIPDSVTSIGEYAFRNCAGLTSITIPDSVTSIGACAFYNCTSLTSISIPDSVTSIGSSAFYCCTSLTDVYYTGTEAQWKAITIGSTNTPLTNATIHYNYVPKE